MVVDKKKDILLYLRDVILSSASIGLLLQVSKTDSISGIEWVSNVGSAPIFLLACLQISSIPSLIRLRPYKSDIKYNHKEITELANELSSFASGFIVFFLGLMIAIMIQCLRYGIDYNSTSLNQTLSYSYFLENEQHLLYCIFAGLQVSIVSGLLSIASSVIFKISGCYRIALIMPILLLKVEDLVANVAYGTTSAKYYYGSIYVLSFGSLKYNLYNSTHIVRILISLFILLTILILSFFLRSIYPLINDKQLIRKMFWFIFIVSLLAVLLASVLRGILLYVSNTEEEISVFFISHLLDNTHILFFVGLIFCLYIDSNWINEKSYIRFIIKSIVNPMLILLILFLLFLLVLFPNISFANSWGKVVHTLSYAPPLQEYEFIVIANHIIEEEYSPIEAAVKSMILLFLSLVFIYLFFMMLRVIANEILATTSITISILMISAGELFERKSWLYYLSPLSWTRLSLNENISLGAFSYPSFLEKLIVLLLLNAVLITALYFMQIKTKVKIMGKTHS